MEGAIPGCKSRVVVAVLHHCQCTIIRRVNVVFMLCKGDKHVLDALCICLIHLLFPRYLVCVYRRHFQCILDLSLLCRTPEWTVRLHIACIEASGRGVGCINLLYFHSGLVPKNWIARTAKCIAAKLVLQKELKWKPSCNPWGEWCSERWGDHVRAKLYHNDHVPLKVNIRVHDILNQVGCRYVYTCCVRMLVCETAVAGFSSIVWRTYARSM